jgi:hypothetical protein
MGGFRARELGATILKVGGTNYRERKNFSFVPLTFGSLEDKPIFQYYTYFVAKQNYMLFITAYMLCYTSLLKNLDLNPTDVGLRVRRPI